MSVLLFSHDAGLSHDTGPGHPERIDRLKAVREALSHPDFAALERREAPRASREQLALCHTATYIDAVFANAPAEGFTRLDPDTVMSPGSLEAALRAAGAACAAVDAVLADEAKSAFCPVRPPGHHAEAGRAMGFCIFSNLAIAARHARAAHGIERVAVVDFDVHHGNGTQHLFEDEPALGFFSTHQYPFYPGTGGAEETGRGNIFNVPLRAGDGSAAFRRAWGEILLPALDAWRPGLLLISAGFDAHARDPLAELNLTSDDFGWLTGELVTIAARHGGGRVVSALEGGYDLQALAESTGAHLRALMAG